MANFEIDTYNELGIEVFEHSISVEYKIEHYDSEDWKIFLSLKYEFVSHDTWGYYDDSIYDEREDYEITTQYGGWIRNVKKFDLVRPKEEWYKYWENFSNNIKDFKFEMEAPIEPQLIQFIKENMATESDFGDTAESMLAFIHGRHLVG